MISEQNPVHRLREIIRERMRLVTELAPFYAALDLVNSQGSGNDVCVSTLEHIPAFREPWLKLEALDKEFDQLAISLALAWERYPVKLYA